MRTSRFCNCGCVQTGIEFQHVISRKFSLTSAEPTRPYRPGPPVVRKVASSSSTPQLKPEALVQRLSPSAKAQHEAFLKKSADLQSMAAHVEDVVTAQSLAPALQRLETVFLKLLVNQGHLTSHFKLTSKPELDARIKDLQWLLRTPTKARHRNSHVVTRWKCWRNVCAIMIS